MLILADAPTGMAAILAEITDITSVVGSVFTLISSNAYLAFFACVGLVIAAIRIFKKLKKAAK